MTDIHCTIRTNMGPKVILKSDLTAVCGLPTFRFNEPVRRNLEKFPSDFLFQLSKEEFQVLTSQSAILKTGRGLRQFISYLNPQPPRSHFFSTFLTNALF